MSVHEELAAALLRDREHAAAEALRLAQLRDELNLRLRLGLAAFNAASLVALLTAVGSAPDFVKALGLVGDTPIFVLSAFALGTILAGVSAFATQNDLNRRSSFAAARVSVLERRISAVAMQDAEEFETATDEERDVFEKSLKPSYVAIAAQNFSGGCWMAGIMTPVAHYLFG